MARLARLFQIAICGLILSRLCFAVTNKEVTRTIDATSPSVKISAEIKATDVDKEYQIAFPSSQAEHLAFLSVKHNKKELKISAPVQKYVSESCFAYIFLYLPFNSMLTLTHLPPTFPLLHTHTHKHTQNQQQQTTTTTQEISMSQFFPCK